MNKKNSPNLRKGKPETKERIDPLMSMAHKLPATEHLERIQPLLENLNLEVCERSLAEHWVIHRIDRVNSSERIRMLYTYIRPEYAVARAIATGDAPSEALQQWQAAIGKMLRDFRKSRRQSLLIEASSAIRHIGGELPGSWPGKFGSLAQSDTAGLGQAVTPLHLALATLAVYQARNLGRVLPELAASTLPLEGWDNPPPLDLTALSEQLQTEQQDKVRLVQQTRQQSEQKEALQTELAQAQEQRQALEQALDSAKQERGNLLKENREKTTKAEQLQGQLAQGQSELKDHQEENDLLLKQLHTVQEELEHFYLRVQELEQPAVGGEPEEAPLPSNAQNTSERPAKRNIWRIFHNIRQKTAQKRQVALIKNSTLFDENWYLRTYPDVAQAGVDAATHYFKFGVAEHRNPGPDFNTEWYLSEHPDVAKAGINPLIHYIEFGQAEERQPASNH